MFSNKAAIAVDALPVLEAEAKQRQRGGQGGVLLSAKLHEAKGRTDLGAILHESSRSDEKAAQLFNVAKGYVIDAKKIKQEASKRQGKRTDLLPNLVNSPPVLEAEARKRLITSGPGIYGGKPASPTLDKAVGRSDEKAAEMFGAARGYVAEAKKIKREAPELAKNLYQNWYRFLARGYVTDAKKIKQEAPDPLHKLCILVHGLYTDCTRNC